MRNLSSIFSHSEYDLLVIGGGINGAAIAHVAAKAGYRVALVEKNDFASGTSSRSTKLMHGGLRYLEQLDFALVKESLRERYIHAKCSPHLVQALRFVIPVYQGDERPLWMMRLGVQIYDWLSGGFLIDAHVSLRPQEVLKLIPGLKSQGLNGGVAFSDCRMDDARMCLENILSAKEHGAHIANYAEVINFIKNPDTGQVTGAEIKDCLTQASHTIYAKHVVCAVGPWTNGVTRLANSAAKDKIRLTKGVHLIYREKVTDTATLLQARGDKRIFFVIPYGPHTLIGTTDTDYTGSPDTVTVQEEDLTYLLDQVRVLFPGQQWRRESIVSSFAGLRPLVFAPGQPSKISRQHVIEKDNAGVTYVTGGKYTTFRVIAYETVEKVFGVRLTPGREFYVFGSGAYPNEEEIQNAAGHYGVSGQTVSFLAAKYGTKYLDVLKKIDADSSLRMPICDCSLTLRAQVAYAIDQEMAISREDIIFRRLGLGFRACATQQCLWETDSYLRGLALRKTQGEQYEK